MSSPCLLKGERITTRLHKNEDNYLLVCVEMMKMMNINKPGEVGRLVVNSEGSLVTLADC